MSSLSLMSGGVPITRAALAELPKPEPKGPRHRPIAFSTVVEMLEQQLRYVGAVITHAQFGTNQNHGQLFGIMTLRTGHEGRYTIARAQQFETTVALRGSVNQTLSWAVGLGSHTFVCDNLVFSADYVLGTRSSGDIANKIAMLLREACGSFAKHTTDEVRMLGELEQTSLSNWQPERYMIAAVRRGVFPASSLPRWISEFDGPTAEEHRAVGNNKLRLYNAATAALRPVKGGRVTTLTHRVRQSMVIRDLIACPIERIAEWEKPRDHRGIRVLEDNGVWRDGNAADLARDAA